jgi:hypothetical protein
LQKSLPNPETSEIQLTSRYARRRKVKGVATVHATVRKSLE